MGACAGSTAGGLKVSRVIILFKAARQDLNKMLHSHAVTTVRFEGKPLDEKTLRGVHNYFNIYMLLLTLSVLLLSLDGFDLVTTFTSVATCTRQERNKYESFIPFLARKGTEKNSKQIKKNAGDCR